MNTTGSSRGSVQQPQPQLDPDPDRPGPGHHVRRHARHQHGPRRNADARGVHGLRRHQPRAIPSIRNLSHLIGRIGRPPWAGAEPLLGHPDLVPGRRLRRLSAGSLPDPLPLRPAARHPAGHLGRRHRSCSKSSLLLFGADLKPMHMPEASGQHLAFGGVTIPVYRVCSSSASPPSVCWRSTCWFYLDVVRPQGPGRGAEPADGVRPGHLDAAGGLADVRLRHRPGRRGRLHSAAYLYTVKYNMGDDYIVEAFMVVILGGMGQLAGSVGGGRASSAPATASWTNCSATRPWPRSSSCLPSSLF